ncbi:MULTISPECIES: Rpn family recombination-promoting nuclease/putative transposase [Halanaerobium]|uniref:Uncharacterized protein DUF4351 n=1 Tax=Halanaerobium congolense TaxID=54121 RepID=A0A1G6PPT1_9FIRM|nr:MULTISPECIES: Rpn family recombination-promoting nuclease/putative transposase [Halanaerobium]KXS48470.1 MAG: Uncharacterized protein AWL62_1897 [Halanaerobium sp. T82-1]OEG62567.1 MAG: hypothetical protein BHK79_06550 [Halanaerobium sp. MDAL1]PTX17359.1 uncharacterized protein DUF4351 [Halanaerobium congolense]PUU87208.1 MAG: Uncharacterized protein CI949_3698 [Halanaerobium sp.]PUU88984.1 MAG: Uncharacterized protein CI948_2109 [Halanaerobium sp.]
MPEKSNTPHDDFFKKTFGRVDISRNFLQSYLPQNLREFVDFSELDPRPISYTGKNSYYSDLLFKSKIGDKKYGVYFLFEHKSYNDKWSVMQIFNYLARIWMREKRTKRIKSLSFIIPILFYHGGNGSLVIKSFAEYFDQNMIENYDLNKYLPDFETVFYDFSNDANLNLLGDRKVRLTLKFFKISKIKDIKVVYQEIISFVISENGVDRDIFYLGLNYIADSREEFNYYILNERLKYEGMKKEADIVISAADKLRTKEAKRILLKQINFKFGNLDPETISLINNAKLEKIEELSEKILTVDSEEEFINYIKH